MKRNLSTGTIYKGKNEDVLNLYFPDEEYFLTFSQALSVGGKVKKGSKGVKIEKWKPVPNSINGKEHPVLIGSWTVFPLSMIEITPEKVESLKQRLNQRLKKAS